MLTQIHAPDVERILSLSERQLYITHISGGVKNRPSFNNVL
jgi:hypothetical protein